MDVSFVTQFLIFLLCATLQFSPSESQKCTSQKFRSNKLFANCTDLPVLNSYLHFNYNSSNSSLSIAFIASPAKPDGWIAWAINPTSTGMVGSQAFIAYKSSGSVIVNTYNISGYTPPQVSKLSFDAWDISAESDGDNMVIFATVKVPEKAESLNQVWQVGSSVTGSTPDKHDSAADNENSKGLLKFAAASSAPAPAPAPASDKSGSFSGIGNWDVSLLAGLFILLGSSLAI